MTTGYCLTDLDRHLSWCKMITLSPWNLWIDWSLVIAKKEKKKKKIKYPLIQNKIKSFHLSIFKEI